MSDIVNTPETVDAIKLMILGCMFADYGARLMVDNTKRTLKYRVNGVLNAVKQVEMHFINHNNTTEAYRQAFKKEFNKESTVALTDLVLLCWQIDADGIDEIVKAVKAVLQAPEEINNQ